MAYLGPEAYICVNRSPMAAAFRKALAVRVRPPQVGSRHVSQWSACSLLALQRIPQPLVQPSPIMVCSGRILEFPQGACSQVTERQAFECAAESHLLTRLFQCCLPSSLRRPADCRPGAPRRVVLFHAAEVDLVGSQEIGL